MYGHRREVRVLIGAWCAALVLAAPAAAQSAGPASGIVAGAEQFRTTQSNALTLTAVVRHALEAYPAVSAARAGLDRAESAAGEVASTRYPFAALDASLSHFQEPMVVAPFHGFSPGALPDFEETLVQAGLTVGYTLWDGGARGARVRRVGTLVDVAAAGVAEAELAVLSQATSAYLNVLTLRDVLAAHDRRRAALESERERTRQLLAEGRAARVQLLRAEASLSAAAADRAATAARLELARRELSRVTGLAVDSLAAERLAPVPGPVAAAPDRALLLEQARTASPGVTRARTVLEAARSSTREVRARFFPTLELAGRYAQYGSGAGEFTGEWNAGVRLSYPVWAGGVRFRALERVAAEERVAEEELRLEEMGAAREVDVALTALTSALARTAALQAAVEQSAEVARIERLALDAGAGMQTDYLAAEAQLLQARAGLAEARHAAIAARIDLARAVGELSIGWIQANVESNP